MPESKNTAPSDGGFDLPEPPIYGADDTILERFAKLEEWGRCYSHIYFRASTVQRHQNLSEEEFLKLLVLAFAGAYHEAYQREIYRARTEQRITIVKS